jgi:hypothetical protein
VAFLQGFLVFGIICSIFWGWAGFFVGGLIGGSLAAMGSSGKETGSASAKTNNGNARKLDVPISKSEVKPSPPPAKAPVATPPKETEESAYVKLVVSCLSVAMAADERSDANWVDFVKEIVSHDSLIPDTARVMWLLNLEVEALKKSREGSGVGFRLRVNDISGHLRHLKGRQDIEHIQIILRALLDRVKSLPAKDVEEILLAMIASLPAASDADDKVIRSSTPRNIAAAEEDRMKLAEDYLLKSGDIAAHAAFREVKKEKRFGLGFINAARSSSVIRTAMGVMIGIVAAEAVKAALLNGTTESLSQLVDKNIEKIGGLESLEGVDVGANFESADGLSPNSEIESVAPEPQTDAHFEPEPVLSEVEDSTSFDSSGRESEHEISVAKEEVADDDDNDDDDFDLDF